MEADGLDGAEYQAGVLPSLPPVTLKDLGRGLLFSWIYLMIWSPVAIPADLWTPENDVLLHAARLAFVTGVFVTSLLWALLHPRIEKAACSLVLHIVCMVLAIVPSALSFYMGITFVERYPLAALITLWLLSGASAGFFVTVWTTDTSAVGERFGSSNAAVSIFFAGMVYVIVMLFAIDVARVTMILLLVVSQCIALGYEMADRKKRANEQQPNERNVTGTAVKQSRFNLFVFSYCFLSGVAESIGSSVGVSELSIVFVGATNVVVGLGMYFSLTVFDVVFDRLYISNVFLPVAATCMLLFAFDVKVLYVIGLSISYAMVAVLNIVNPAYLVGDKKRFLPLQRQSKNTGRWGRVSDTVAVACGFGIGTALLFSDVSWQISCLLLCVIMVICGSLSLSAWVKEDNGIASLEPVEQNPMEVRAKKLEELANQYDLSAREREVFSMLADGRNRNYIAEHLFISVYTARTHTYNIYRKINVHSQQDLIDFVERNM